MSIRACGSVYGPEVSYTNTGGLAPPPNCSGVGACAISRIGTRMSGRLPVTWILRELGSGWTAALSTVAVVESNFMWLLLQAGASKGDMGASGPGGTWRACFPSLALSRSGSEGVSHPRLALPRFAGPLALLPKTAAPAL